jgi:hypothetical protein
MVDETIRRVCMALTGSYQGWASEEKKRVMSFVTCSSSSYIFDL